MYPNITEAINLGLDLLEATKKEVSIEIIQHETKGFLGIRSKEAIVKLSKLEKTTIVENSPSNDDPFKMLEQMIDSIPEQNFKKINTSLNEEEHFNDNNNDVSDQTNMGKVWVKNGMLQCHTSPMHFPMVTLSNGIKLFKNGQAVTEKTTIVTEKDFFEIQVENEEKETMWQMTMDQDRLKVLLNVEPGYKITRSIPDIEPDQHIRLIVNEKKDVYNNLSYETILQKLNMLRVKHGFNQDQITKAMGATEPGSYEIATGIKPKPGLDGWLELKVDIDAKVGPREDDDGNVNYREIRTIPTAKSGQVIAIVHPPTPGQCGYTVTNEPLPAKQTVPIMLKIGRGISAIDDKIVAMESGRPHIEKRGQIVRVSIMPKHTQFGDVDITSGNIRFSGDVEVIGNISESMVVEADGDIIVHNEVNKAKLTASGAILTYGNIVGSEISAGKNNMLITELGHLLGILHQHVEKMVVLIQQLTHSPAFKDTDFSRGGLKPLLSILLGKKFKSFPPLAKKYVSVVRKGEDYLNDNDWKEVADSLTQLFLSLTNEVISQERIIQLSKKMKELHEMSKTPAEPDSFISIPSSSNSSIYCSGNVTITGKGCVNSKIHAGGLLKIGGIIRGGEVYGRLGVDIMEAGSEIGTPTLIAVPSDQKIKITKALEGTTIKIGNVKYSFKETTYRVLARLDQEERIVFD